jgi:hypothetical protein
MSPFEKVTTSLIADASLCVTGFLMGRGNIHGWEVLVGFAVPLYMLWLVASEQREVPGEQVLSTDRRGDCNPELAALPHSGERSFGGWLYPHDRYGRDCLLLDPRRRLRHVGAARWCSTLRRGGC